jgi:hypothetical protein
LRFITRNIDRNICDTCAAGRHPGETNHEIHLFGLLRQKQTRRQDRGRETSHVRRLLIYDDHLRANGHWVGGEPIQPAETALTLYWKNGKVATPDGPYAETKEQLGGILILEARDLNCAHQLISHHPSLKYGAIFEIRPDGDLNELLKASEQRRQKNTAR